MQKDLMQIMYLLCPTAGTLNTKSGQIANKKELKAALKVLYNLFNGNLSQELNEVTSHKDFFKGMKSFMHLGASMYLVGVHFFVLKFIFLRKKTVNVVRFPCFYNS